VTFEEARAQFPALENVAYLNAGTNGPLARSTVEAMVARLLTDLARGRSGTDFIKDMDDARARARDLLAEVLGVGRENVALTTSTTDSCNVVISGLELGPADEIVTTDIEHFGLLGPVHGSGSRVRVAAVGERHGDDAFDAIAAEIGPRTRLLALSHVSWASGNRLPVERLAAETGIPVLVDGAQSAGAVEVDAGLVDFYTVSCQKWLCGPDTTGALYVRDPESLHVARPCYASQSSYEPNGAFVPREGAPRFDTGWTPTASMAGLAAAIESRPEWAYERALEMTARCRELIADRFELVSAPDAATLVVWRPDGDADEAAKRCAGHGVVVRSVPGWGWLRASCGWWTSDEDLERLLAALA
jgi:L-cysteine/cystine lyase